MENNLLQTLDHAYKAITHLNEVEKCFPEERTFSETLLRLQQLAANTIQERETLLLEKAREQTSYQYNWSWWAYPSEQKEGKYPVEISPSGDWHEFEIDAITAACKDPCLHHNSKDFYVCLLRTRSEYPGLLGFSLKYCMAPWTRDGALPSVGSKIDPRVYRNSMNMLDAVYAALEESKSFDVWDGPSGVNFILLQINQ